MANKSKKNFDKKKKIIEENINQGIEIIKAHSLFGRLEYYIDPFSIVSFGKNSYAHVASNGYIIINREILATPEEWAYIIAHNILHLSFGHFDKEKLDGIGGIDKSKDNLKNNMKSNLHTSSFVTTSQTDSPYDTRAKVDIKLWNIACDIYISKFLADMKFGTPISKVPINSLPFNLTDEYRIYNYLAEHTITEDIMSYGTAIAEGMDMIGLEHPIEYKNGNSNRYASIFGSALAHSVSNAVSIAGGHTPLDAGDKYSSKSMRAASWFISSYPLLGGLAAGFKVIEDYSICQEYNIQIAAIDVTVGEIYVNPTANLSEEELKFVMAHEYLHAGLSHHQRCDGRDKYLWNVACDYVINSWLIEMQIGVMPEQGLLYDECLKGMSAETIYDMILDNMRKYSKLDTFRGYGQGDIIDAPLIRGKLAGVGLDDFCKSALLQGLDIHIEGGRGYIPRGLVEEIRALAMPAIAWDVELARWFDGFFGPLEKKRTYARLSRRQSSSPDIPRPRYVVDETLLEGRTFGVVLDTSGSMSIKTLAKALGVIASYSVSREVPYVRVIFCDAMPYDIGYISPEDIAGRVKVKGRGGTVLQPGIDKLENANDFPKNGPILIITDGWCEEKLHVNREHAYLLPKGRSLPFRARGKVFYFD